LNLLLFGAPGAGKGTQSNLLKEKQNLAHISTGDLFRRAMKQGTKLGIEAKGFIDKGQLVPDQTTIGMVEEELQRLEGRGFILDGFPRTTNQALALERLLVSRSTKLDRVVSLQVPREELIRRLAGRRVCKSCGTVYHVLSHPTKTEGICDVCGSDVVQRSDDREEVVAERLKAYEVSTQPLKEFYQERHLFLEVDGTGSEGEVYSRIMTGLGKKNG
jgi:adenylate kinase